jgi:signal transduction histidine kinase
MTRDAAKDFRKQALQILKEGLDTAQTQHPLDIQQIFQYDRPTLGGSVPIELYRAIRLLAFREALGAEMAAAVLKVTGRSVGRKLGVTSVKELVSTLKTFAIGNTEVKVESDDRMVFTSSECATCSGLPAIGETFCHFEAGIIAGGLETVFGKPVNAVETKCWGLGDRVCSWEASVLDGHAAGSLDSLELVMALAGKAATAMNSTYAVKQSNRELREAYRQLRETQRLAKDLTDMVVHDLRVPLSAVIGSIQTITELAEPDQDNIQAELLQMALSSSNTMLQMINDLLDISKLEEQKMPLKRRPAAVEQIIEEAVNNVAIIAKRRRIKLRREIASELPFVSIDSDKILRVLLNLLGNALQHTAAGGEVVISAARDRAGALKISVSDTGAGIPKEFQKKIFDKFVQVESGKSKKRASSGLGLTFCKLVVEAHGGKIWVDSEPGLGSTFILTIPHI